MSLLREISLFKDYKQASKFSIFVLAKFDLDVPKDSILTMEFNPYKSEQFLLLTKHDIWIGVSGVSI